MEQSITKEENGQNLTIFKMDVTIVCLDVKGRPTRIPEELRNRFNDYLKEK
jgi:acyl-CoA thioesterase FadM